MPAAMGRGGWRAVLLGLGLMGGNAAQGAATSLAFTITMSGNTNVPLITVRNDSKTAQISRFEMTIGDLSKSFDSASDFVPPPGGSIMRESPDGVNGGTRSSKVVLQLSGFDPGESFSMYVDVDALAADTVEDYRRTFFNNGAAPEAVVTVGGEGLTAFLVLPANPGLQSSYSFSLQPPLRTLRITSVAEAGGSEFVTKARLRVDGALVTGSDGKPLEIGSQFTTNVFDGATIEISAPQEVYKNIHGVDITDSVENDPAKIQQDAEERFTAIGITVNDVPQTGDPTLYRFDISRTTDVVVKWRHDYALTVAHDFAQTESLEKDAFGNPWAGPLASEASGNPEPAVKKNWVKRGDTVVAQVDGQVLDFSRPGLDVRYVPKAYKAYGPPNVLRSAQANQADRLGGMDIRTQRVSAFDFTGAAQAVDLATVEIPQSPPPRQQVRAFTMSGPAGITYVWQLQFGIRVNVDSLSFAALPRVYRVDNGMDVEVGSGEGTFWFKPGARVKVVSAAQAAGPTSPALNGWMNGDGYYFSSSGDIRASDGQLAQGGPATGPNNGPVGLWLAEYPSPLAPGQTRYRGLEIPQLQRAARVLWRYGAPVLVVEVAIGEHLFQNDPARAEEFNRPPDQIQLITVDGRNRTVGPNDLTVWDPEAARLYPVVPGQFRATMRPASAVNQTVDVLVTARYPQPAHYPHIAGTPPVALDPDPNDDFIFREVRYSENEAAVDGNRRFTADVQGRTVLLFSERQRSGRVGQPREFLRVRVVETRGFEEGLTAGVAIIGQRIADPGLDRARLGTGYVMSQSALLGQPDTARYNPRLYDAAKLEGLAAKDIYDLEALRSDRAEKRVIRPENLPGPIIPVNLHPGAALPERVIVVWYDDPAENDELLWPHRARYYLPRWPVDASEGLGRIVIASQFGSESVDAQGEDQPVVPAVGNAPAETTYNPSRLQQVQVYSQPDPGLPGYNPNEEHALMAPSLRFAQVSPRPPAVYALRDRDLNFYRAGEEGEAGQPANYTSHPYVLVEFFDVAEREAKMRVYRIERDDPGQGYAFANQTTVTPGSGGQVTVTSAQLFAEPHVRMEAGEPVIPFYPLGVVIGASPCAQTFGEDLKGQATYWEDHKGSTWAVSGGTEAWFTVSFHYPLAPDFWWPANEPGFIREGVENRVVVPRATVPQAGDCVAFLPKRIRALRSLAPDAVVDAAKLREDITPTKVLFKSDWPAVAPILKAGETLTFAGGEYRADPGHATTPVVDETGAVRNVETPGLPGVVAFATAEVVFDSLNPLATTAGWTARWTARIAQVLDRRAVPLALADFPPDLQPATRRTRAKEGKYIFTELPASLQKRVRYDPLLGKLEMIGLLNDKEIGDRTLTAAPPAVYILEPNILTREEEERLLALSGETKWVTAVAQLARLTRNPGFVDSDSATLPAANDPEYRSKLEQFWTAYYRQVGDLPVGGEVPPIVPLFDIDTGYLVGLEPKVLRDGTGRAVTIEDPAVPGLRRPVSDPRQAAPVRAFGPGLALVPNPDFLDPEMDFPESWVVVAENNDPSLGGSPITLHVIKVVQEERYRGAIKTVVSDNVFDENLVLRHTGDFGANADALVFEWWYRPDDGTPSVPPPDLVSPLQSNPWKVFPDPTGKRGLGRYQITLKGNPNAPEALLADSWWFVRYRHVNDVAQGTNWRVRQPSGRDGVNFTWAGAGNSDPFNDFDGDGVFDYRAQLAQGWIKRVLDAVNPYEARIRDFEGENPSTRVSMVSQFGPRFEGPVALNPDKNVIENVGLIELYETILKRGRDLSIDLSRPVSTPAIANALQLASTRIADFYTILGNEAYADAQDPSVGITDSEGEMDPGHVWSSVFSFQNQMASLIEEELALLRGVDDEFARPVYNRLFWNFTKGEGEAAYAVNYEISDVNQDGFVDEADAMVLYPQGHGDAWGHYLTAVRNQYELLQHENFNWVSRSENYNLQDIVLTVDFLDERKFAATAAARAKTGAEIVGLTYREKYVEDPTAQWQGYTDSNPDRAWGVEEWARRAGQGAYFDWVMANALLPAVHPNDRLEGIEKVDRKANADIAVISANLNAIQNTFDQANKGQNPLGVAANVVPFDINPILVEDLTIYGKTHFEQIYERALKALENAQTVWNYANDRRNRIRQISNNETEFRNSVFQEDLSYRNQLIAIFGKPYEGTIGPGRVYPAGYDGPDLLLYMYVDVREINDQTVPGPTTTFATFTGNTLTDGELYQAFQNGVGRGGLFGSQVGRQNLYKLLDVSASVRQLFSPTLAPDAAGNTSALARDGWYSVKYTDLDSPKVALENLTKFMPVTAAGYTFQAPRDWGRRQAQGELQSLINQMLQQEAAIASAIGAWDALQGEIIRAFRLTNAKLDLEANIRLKNEVFTRLKYLTANIIKGAEGAIELAKAVTETTSKFFYATGEAIPTGLPIVGLAVSPGDALAPARSGIKVIEASTFTGLKAIEGVFKIGKVIAEISLDIAENELELFEKREQDGQSVKEALVELENKLGDEPIKRIEVFKEIQALRDLSEQYRAKVDEGVRLIDERAAFNKRVAAQTQRSRYQDMTFRVSRNHALQSYRSAFDLAAKYAYLAAKAYDYETNLDPSDPGSPVAIFADIVRARTLGEFETGDLGELRTGTEGLAGALGWLRMNHQTLKTQLGINNPQNETGKMSLRTEAFRILPPGSVQPGAGEGGGGFPGPGEDADELWRQTLERAWVDDLWQVPEFRYYCRPFASESTDGGNHQAEPGLVLRFSTRVVAGQNFFGHPLSGGDHAFDPSQYAIKIRSVGVWFSDYLSEDILNDLPATPRVYLIPVGTDIMGVPSSDDPGVVRAWKVVDQRIPVPLPSTQARLDQSSWIPLLDSLNGRLGEPRKFSTFRAYHDGGSAVNLDELVSDSRLVGRSVWNTQWLLIIPGRLLNAVPAVGLERFIEQVTDIKLVFQTYAYSGG